MPELTEKPDLGDFSKNEFFDLETPPFDVQEYALYSVVSGSNAYGTNVEGSDVDERGVVVPPKKYFYGMANFEQVENQTKDVCYYALKKFFSLAYKNNVHALEMLWLNCEFVHFLKKPFDQVLNNREMFMSKQLGYSFGGYAYQQLKILNVKTKNKTGRINLVEKYGYDTKFAAHVVRLYRSGAGALETGELKVFRPDREELKAIRAGAMSFSEFVQYDDKNTPVGGFAFDEMQKFKKAFEKSNLPANPNYHKVEDLLMQVHSEVPWLQ